MVISVRPLTRPEYAEWMGEPPVYTLRGFTVRRDGVLLGIGGVIVERDRLLAFAEAKDWGAVPRQTIWRLALILVGYATRYGAPIIARATPSIPGSGRFLERLGFLKVQEDNAGDVYLWQN